MVIYQTNEWKVSASRIITGMNTGWKAAPFTSTSATGKSSLTVMKTTGILMKPWKHPGKRMIQICRNG